MIIDCPNCHNRPICNPFEQKNDVPCYLCAGRGKVDNEKICRECGRPATMLLLGVPVCRALLCQKEISDQRKNQPLTEEDVDAAQASMNDAWGGWAGLIE